jgi:hypothetical protein
VKEEKVMKKLHINHYNDFLIKFGNDGEIAKTSRSGLYRLFDHLYGHEDEDGLQSLQITPIPCEFNEHDFMWFNSDLELIGETA